MIGTKVRRDCRRKCSLKSSSLFKIKTGTLVCWRTTSSCQGPAHIISLSLKEHKLNKLCRIQYFLFEKEIDKWCLVQREAYFFPPFELDTATHLSHYKVAAVFLSLVPIIGKAAATTQKNNCVFNARRKRLLTAQWSRDLESNELPGSVNQSDVVFIWPRVH